MTMIDGASCLVCGDNNFRGHSADETIHYDCRQRIECRFRNLEKCLHEAALMAIGYKMCKDRIEQLLEEECAK